MDDLLNFAGYLVDNFEGTVIREETVMVLLDSFVKSEYNKKGLDILSEPILTAFNSKYKQCKSDKEKLLFMKTSG